MIFPLLVTVLCILFLFISHVVLNRFLFREALIISFFVSFALTCVIFTFMHLFIFSFYQYLTNESIWLFLGDTIILICLSYCYINFINIGNASVRIRILNQIYSSRYGITIDDILKEYDSKKILKIRLERLIDNGQIIQYNQKYFLGKSRQILLAKFFLFWRHLIIK